MRVTKKALITAITAASLLGSVSALAVSEYNTEDTRLAPWEKAVKDEDGAVRQLRSVTNNDGGVDNLINRNKVISLSAGGKGIRDSGLVDVNHIIANSNTVTNINEQMATTKTQLDQNSLKLAEYQALSEADKAALNSRIEELEAELGAAASGGGAQTQTLVTSSLGLYSTAHLAPNRYHHTYYWREGNFRQDERVIEYDSHIYLCEIFAIYSADLAPDGTIDNGSLRFVDSVTADRGIYPYNRTVRAPDYNLGTEVITSGIDYDETYTDGQKDAIRAHMRDRG